MLSLSRSFIPIEYFSFGSNDSDVCVPSLRRFPAPAEVDDLEVARWLFPPPATFACFLDEDVVADIVCRLLLLDEAAGGGGPMAHLFHRLILCTTTTGINCA